MLVDISLEEAQMQILKHTCLVATESISILEAGGRICARDIFADADLPPIAQSAVDGYALGEDDGSGNYVLNTCLSLGDKPLAHLSPGQAMGVLTGGDLPGGTRAVVPHEKVNIQNNYLTSMEVVKPGNNIKQAGEDYIQGDLLVERGLVLTPGSIGLLAAYGKDRIPVYRKPRVAVLSLNRQLVSFEKKPEQGQIRDSNSPLLSALIVRDGGILVSASIAGQEMTEAKSTAMGQLELADALIITGGTYAEGGNEARLLMEELGAELIYWDVPIMPGSHTGASIMNSHLLFAISGNPASCAVGYELFIAPTLRFMQGLQPYAKAHKAKCLNGFPKKTGSRRFVRGYASWGEDGWEVSVLPGQKPSMMRSLVNCNALIDVPAQSPAIEAGSEVSIILLNPLY